MTTGPAKADPVIVLSDPIADRTGLIGVVCTAAPLGHGGIEDSLCAVAQSPPGVYLVLGLEVAGRGKGRLLSYTIGGSPNLLMQPSTFDGGVRLLELRAYPMLVPPNKAWVHYDLHSTERAQLIAIMKPMRSHPVHMGPMPEHEVISRAEWEHRVGIGCSSR